MREVEAVGNMRKRGHLTWKERREQSGGRGKGQGAGAGPVYPGWRSGPVLAGLAGARVWRVLNVGSGRAVGPVLRLPERGGDIPSVMPNEMRLPCW